MAITFNALCEIRVSARTPSGALAARLEPQWGRRCGNLFGACLMFGSYEMVIENWPGVIYVVHVRLVLGDT